MALAQSPRGERRHRRADRPQHCERLGAVHPLVGGIIQITRVVATSGRRRPSWTSLKARRCAPLSWRDAGAPDRDQGSREENQGLCNKVRALHDVIDGRRRDSSQGALSTQRAVVSACCPTSCQRRPARRWNGYRAPRNRTAARHSPKEAPGRLPGVGRQASAALSTDPVMRPIGARHKRSLVAPRNS
jgi:hypothetical protein